MTDAPPGPLAPIPRPTVEREDAWDAPDAGDPRLRGVRLLASVLDDAIEIPGTGWRIGLDPVVGLVPGVGDLATALFSTYVILTAWRLGAPASVLARVVLNVGVDAVIGAIPLAGDLFDAGWKSNRRNLRLLEGWLARPHATRRASRLAVAGLLAVMLLVIAAVVFAVWRLVAWAAAGIGA